MRQRDEGLALLSRRLFCSGALSLGASAGVMVRAARARSGPAWADLSATFDDLEAADGGRLGVAVLDIKTAARAGHRASELFPMCSTFKLLAAAAILKRVDAGEERLDRRIPFGASDLVVNSPT